MIFLKLWLLYEDWVGLGVASETRFLILMIASITYRGSRETGFLGVGGVRMIFSDYGYCMRVYGVLTRSGVEGRNGINEALLLGWDEVGRVKQREEAEKASF